LSKDATAIRGGRQTADAKKGGRGRKGRSGSGGA